jgi:hypothetical protein
MSKVGYDNKSNKEKPGKIESNDKRVTHTEPVNQQ